MFLCMWPVTRHMFACGRYRSRHEACSKNVWPTRRVRLLKKTPCLGTASIRGTGSISWLAAGSAIDIEQAAPNMKWLTRFASSQKNIDCVAAWFGGAIALLGVVLVLVILVSRIFK
jgi:hypothetical protein